MRRLMFCLLMVTLVIPVLVGCGGGDTRPPAVITFDETFDDPDADPVIILSADGTASKVDGYYSRTKAYEMFTYPVGGLPSEYKMPYKPGRYVGVSVTPVSYGTASCAIHINGKRVAFATSGGPSQTADCSVYLEPGKQW